MFFSFSIVMSSLHFHLSTMLAMGIYSRCPPHVVFRDCSQALSSKMFGATFGWVFELPHLATLLLFLAFPGAQEVLRIGNYYIFFCNSLYME